MSLVFVYGTLKRGQYNHNYLEKFLKDDTVKFVGTAKTCDKFPLITTECGAPMLLFAKGTGKRVIGEVYDADERVMADLDILEAVAMGLYSRETVDVEIIPEGLHENTSKCMKVVVYVIKEFKSELLQKEFNEKYDYSSQREAQGKLFENLEEYHQFLYNYVKTQNTPNTGT